MATWSVAPLWRPRVAPLCRPRNGAILVTRDSWGRRSPPAQAARGRNKRRTGRYAGRVRLAVAPDRSAQSLGGFIERSVTPGSTIITDDWSGYVKLGERGYYHTAVAERGDMHIAETFLPIIHLVFSNLKAGCAASTMVLAPALAGLSQRIHVPLQPPFLSLQRLPLPARHRWRRHRANLYRALRRKITTSPPHLGGGCDNPISTVRGGLYEGLWQSTRTDDQADRIL